MKSLKDLVFMTGLPRSGSGIICDTLNGHHQIATFGRSPLCSIVNSIRKTWIDEPLLYEVYPRFYTALQAFMYGFNGCFEDGEASVVIDHNQEWLTNVDSISHLFPSFKMIVVVRNIEDIYRETEAASRATLLCKPQESVDERAIRFFSDDHTLGRSLSFLNNLKKTSHLLPHIYFVRIEDFVNNAVLIMEDILNFLGVEIVPFTPPSNLLETLSSPKVVVPEEILSEIKRRYEGFYGDFYANVTERANDTQQTSSVDSSSQDSSSQDSSSQLAAELERDIQAEISS